MDQYRVRNAKDLYCMRRRKDLITCAHSGNEAISSFPVPPNGLVIYCGTIVTEEGKEKKVNIDFEPFKPINTSLYLCDNKVSIFCTFHYSAQYKILVCQLLLHISISGIVTKLHV